MDVLVCVKRVPATGGRIALTADERDIDTRFLGFTISPHEECAVEEAVRIVEANGGTTTVLTLGPEQAADQLRDALAIGIDRAILLVTDGSDWDPGATATAITAAIRGLEATSGPFDLILFGNESADSGGFQVGLRVATALDRPIVTGAKGLTVDPEGASATVRRQVKGGWEIYDVALPAVVSVREGINLPRYPSVPGRIRAKRKEIERIAPAHEPLGPVLIRLILPVERRATAEILGAGPEAAPRVVEIMREIGVL